MVFWRVTFFQKCLFSSQSWKSTVRLQISTHRSQEMSPFQFKCDIDQLAQGELSLCIGLHQSVRRARVGGEGGGAANIYMGGWNEVGSGYRPPRPLVAFKTKSKIFRDIFKISGKDCRFEEISGASNFLPKGSWWN